MIPRPERGLVLGKFMPPHTGHVLLCDFARHACERLTILVCSLPDDLIPGEVRSRWMQQMFPNCEVAWCNETVPQTPEDSPDFWPIWRDLIGRYVGPVDMVAASEPYGQRLADELGARFMPCDQKRQVQPVSGTAVRSDPFGYWDYIPPVVRPWFVKRVCVFGPESTGKTTLAEALARAFQTVWVPEYGRLYTETFGTGVRPEDLARIALGHQALREATVGRANRVLIEDTDEVLTAVWSDMLAGSRQPWMQPTDTPADLYLLTDIDLPWADDGTRYFPDAKRRQEFMDRCRQELADRRLPYVVVRGDGDARTDAAIAAVKIAFDI